MNFGKLSLFGLSFFSLLGIASENLTIKDAVQKAIEHNPSLQETKEKINQAQTQVGSAQSLLFPNVSATLGAEEKKDAVNPESGGAAKFNGDTYNFYNFTGQFTQPLLQKGILSGVQVPKKAVELQKIQYELAERTLSLNVLQSFYTLLLQERNLASLRGVQITEKEALSTSQSRYRIGRGQLLDVLQAKTQLALLEPQLSAAQTQASVAALELARLMGTTTDQSPQITVSGTLEIPPVQKLKQRAEIHSDLSQLPEYRQVIATKDQLDYQRDLTLGKNWPSLQAMGTWGRSGYTKSDLFDSGTSAWTLGLQVAIPLFSGLSSLHDRDSLNSQATQLDFEQENVKQQLLISQSEALKNLDLTEKNVDSAKVAFDLALASLNEARRNYRLATIDFLQFLSVQQAFFQAESALNQARYSYVVAAANYYVSSGLPLGELVQTLSQEAKAESGK